MRNLRSAAGLGLVLALAACALLLGCGKKGPPLPPLEGMRPRVIDLEVTQAGRGARATFTLPIRPGARLVDYETLGVELWRRDKRAEGTRAQAGPPPALQRGAGDPNAPPEVPLQDFLKDATLVASVGGGEMFDFLALPVLELRDAALPETVGADGLEYAVVLKTDARKSGTVSNLAPLAPLPAPDRPSHAKAEAVEGAVKVTWTPITGAAPPEPPKDGEPAKDAAPAGPLPVNVYRAVDGGPLGLEPVGGSPFTGTMYTDDEVVSGSTYRYVLRSVLKTSTATIESDPTDEVSADYRDVFPPAAPKGLRVIPEEGRVNLVWNPGTEHDLGGYHVYRRERGGEWTRLDTAPIPSATFSDRGAPAGTPLEYAVTAHDRTEPPNESAKSAPVSVTVETEP